MRIFAAALVICISACAHVPNANNRPPRLNPPASELLPKCIATVRFNEDEDSVPESDYLDAMFCLGLMEGVLNTNRIAFDATGKALFCIPRPGIKNWLAAKAVVEFAEARPHLLVLEETDFVVKALAHKFPC